MSQTEVVAHAPEIPSKWDVIPIHTSDIASFKRCRRYWDWTSPTRTNLRRRVDIHGVNIALWFGTGIHYALEMYYDPILKRDPVEAFKTWYTFQWEGGMVTEDWLGRVYDLHPQYAGEWIGDPSDTKTLHKAWNVTGLKDLLPNVEVVQEEFELHYDLGIGMLNFYKDWSAKNDDFVVVAAEADYSIPLGFEAIDGREDSPNYGKALEVHARGKRDAILYWPDVDRYGINDYKTAAKIGEEYSAKLEKDEQCSNYLWATIQEAEMFDLPWHGKRVDRVLYTAMRKNYPKPPTMLQSGFPSLNRTTEGTTADLFKEAVIGNEMLEEWFRTNEKAQAYYTHLCEYGDSLFIVRDVVTRNQHEINNTGKHLVMIAREMTSTPHIYPNPTGEFRCIQCAFRAPCVAADDGSDWKGMLADGYEQNRGR